MPLEGEIRNLCYRSIGRIPGDHSLLSLDASLAVPKIWDCVVAHRSDQCSSPVRPVRPIGQTGLELLHLRLRFFCLGFVDQPRNPVVFC
jgi:hypothetical protein